MKYLCTEDLPNYPFDEAICEFRVVLAQTSQGKQEFWVVLALTSQGKQEFWVVLAQTSQGKQEFWVVLHLLARVNKSLGSAGTNQPR